MCFFIHCHFQILLPDAIYISSNGKNAKIIEKEKYLKKCESYICKKFDLRDQMMNKKCENYFINQYKYSYINEKNILKFILFVKYQSFIILLLKFRFNQVYIIDILGKF